VTAEVLLRRMMMLNTAKLPAKVNRGSLTEDVGCVSWIFFD
jgi:hypothetical protein